MPKSTPNTRKLKNSDVIVESPQNRNRSLANTYDLRGKMLGLWSSFEDGSLKAAEARIHIGFCRVVLDTLKVEIAAQHVTKSNVPALNITGDINKP